LVDVVNNLDISYLTDLSFIELVATINNLDISYVTDLCFNEYILLQNDLINNIEDTLIVNDLKINDISNRDLSINANLDPYFINQIHLLTSENVLLKTDINYNRSLIQTNAIDFNILKSRIEIIDENITYFNNSLQDISVSFINNDLLNVIDDISTSLHELNENFASQNILFKLDVLLANSNINYNTAKIYFLEDSVNNLNNKFSDLLTTYNSLDLSNILNIDNTYIQRLESKLTNLVNILNSQTNLNININTL
tara:strand:- start:2788 stop:3549 length:762 start_codon:yes stop_codon:yes gene_type:complete